MKRFIGFMAVLILVMALGVGMTEAACTQAMATSYKAELFQGTHTSSDTYKIVLYTAATANLGPGTTVYSNTGEVAGGSGYTQGGQTLVGFTVTTSGTTAILDWTTDPSWGPSATITADCWGIYNSSKSNKWVATGTFSQTISTNSTFLLPGPTPDASNGWLRW